MLGSIRYVRSQVRILLPGVLVALVVGIIAYDRGIPYGWDELNYHYYNGYAFATSRQALDLAPAGIQTWFNPFLDAAYYVSKNLIGWQATQLALCLLQTMSLLLVLAFAEWQLREYQGFTRLTLLALAGVMSVVGPLTRSQIGSTTHDLTTGIIVIAGLMLLVRELVREADANADMNSRQLVMSGLLIGAAVGLKLTNAVFALSAMLAFATIAVFWRPTISAKNLVVFGLSLGVGFGSFEGPWAYHLWMRYNNPLFPMANSLFNSPYWDGRPSIDARYHAKSLTDAVLYPLKMTFAPQTVGEGYWLDLRHLVTYFLCALAGLAIAWITLCRGRMAPIVSSSAGLAADYRKQSGVKADIFLVLFSAFSYIAWAWISGVFRYLWVLEALSFVIMLAALRLLAFDIGFRAFALTALCLVSISSAYLGSESRIAWEDVTSESLVAVPEQLSESSGVIAIVGDGPVSFVIPYFPPQLHFIRLEGRFTPGVFGPVPTVLLREYDSRHRSRPSTSWSMLLFPDDPDGASRAEVFAQQRFGGLSHMQCQRITAAINQKFPVKFCQ
jgi:hypothetical protein